MHSQLARVSKLPGSPGWDALPTCEHRCTANLRLSPRTMIGLGVVAHRQRKKVARWQRVTFGRTSLGSAIRFRAPRPPMAHAAKATAPATVQETVAHTATRRAYRDSRAARYIDSLLSLPPIQRLSRSPSLLQPQPQCDSRAYSDTSRIQRQSRDSRAYSDTRQSRA